MNTKLFNAACEAHCLPVPQSEYQFLASRKWRFDFAWPDYDVALEIEGGAWTRGRHTRGKGFLADMSKYNEAAISGWFVLRCTPEDVESGAVFALLRRAIYKREET